MRAVDIPLKIQQPWAASAGPSYVRVIPQNSQQGVQAGAASWPDGFPPLNFVPVAAGGVEPFGADMNGVLNELSALLRWYSAGGTVPYDSVFQTAVGGYPKGAIVQSVTAPGLFWLSTTDNNSTNPDAAGAGWVNAYSPPAGTVLAYAGSVLPLGYLAVPTAPTLISTTTYAGLFAAIGYTWGGSGASFGLPYLASGYVPIAGTVGALTHGALLAHTHVTGVVSGNNTLAAAGVVIANVATGTSSSAGGADNLAAGMGHQFIVKY